MSWTDWFLIVGLYGLLALWKAEASDVRNMRKDIDLLKNRIDSFEEKINELEGNEDEYEDEDEA